MTNENQHPNHSIPPRDRSALLTEQRLPESMNLDSMSIEECLALMNAQDALAVAAVNDQLPAVAAAVRWVVAALSGGGRLFYVGAGTSGRLGVLDAAECPPTFNTDPDLVQGVIAGGDAAMFRSRENAEDSAHDGAVALAAKKLTQRDVVIGIAAGGTTPFVAGALRHAGAVGVKTILLCCVKQSNAEPPADLVIRPLVGPEVLTGSTRLKAATATKLIVNQITTAAMVQLGKTHENLMVDLRATNQKLRDRAARIVAAITGLSREQAIDLLAQADGEVKTAIVMNKKKIPAPAARDHLAAAHGNLRAAL